MATTSGSVMLRAAVHLNDSSQLVWTNTILLQPLNMALEELEEELAVHEIAPLRKESAAVNVAIGATSITVPADFVSAIDIQERPQGSSERWREIREASDLDNNLVVQPGTEILQWVSRGGAILINPPTSAREVLLGYLKTITPATGAATNLDLEMSRRYLGLVTARNAARDLGNSKKKADDLEPDIGRARDRLMRRLTKESQNSMGVRRRAFSGG